MEEKKQKRCELTEQEKFWLENLVMNIRIEITR